MSFLFVSHRSLDDSCVDELVACLREHGIETWVDHIDGIGPGDDIDLEIQNALNTCEAGLVVHSNTTIDSPEVRSEIRHLINEGRRLYVARIEDMNPGKYHWRLSTIAYVDLANDPESFSTLVNAILKKQVFNLDDDRVHIERSFTSKRAVDPQLFIDILGRGDDLAKVFELLESRFPTTITGIGGTGKSRLAYEVALSIADVGSVIWHKCTDVSSANDILDLLKTHFGLGHDLSVESILGHIPASNLLVVVDNAESIQESQRRIEFIELTNQLCQDGAKILFTSREMWPEMLRAHQHTLQELPRISATDVCLAMSELEGVCMTNSQAATLVDKAFKHPRLIELAVKMCKTRDFERVIQSFESLKGRKIEKHLDEMIMQTIQFMQESYNTYGPMAAEALRRLNVFRGGFTFDAAKAIMMYPASLALPTGEDDLDECLDLLQQWKFVWRDHERNRYNVDSLVAASVGEDEIVYDAHYEYYSALANEHNRIQDYRGLEPEIDNLSVAFERKLNSGRIADAYLLCHKSLRLFFNRTRFAEWQGWLEKVQPKIEDGGDEFLRAHLAGTIGDSYTGTLVGNRSENLRNAIPNYETALAYFTLDRDQPMHAALIHNLGHAYWLLSDHEDHVSNLKKAICYFKASLSLTDPVNSGTIRSNLGNCYAKIGLANNDVKALETAISWFREALAHTSSLTASLSYANTNFNLANAYFALSKHKDFQANVGNALSSVEKALQYVTPENDPMAYGLAIYNRSLYLFELARLHHCDQYMDLAVSGFKEALIYYSAEHDPGHRALILQALGVANSNMGNTDEAIELWSQAKKLFEAVANVDGANRMQAYIVDAIRKV